MKADKCLHCGKCCIIYNNIYKKWENCKYLKKIDGSCVERVLDQDPAEDTYCEIYNTRIGTNLGFGFVCRMREDLKFNIPGCPYNKKGLNIHPAYK